MEERITSLAYNPSALVNIFNNALNSEATRKVFKITGVYLTGKGQSYNGYYYDTLKDETSDACITLIIPSLIRSTLHADQIIECVGYLTKRVQLNGARIELQVNVIEVVSQQAGKYTEEQLRAFEILQKKAEQGYRDVDGFIKSRILEGQPITIKILIGKTGIIDGDIKHQLKEAISFYKFHFLRISLTSETEVIQALKNHEDADILVVSRGGGENLTIFDRPSIAEVSLTLKCLFVTAIGHKENISVLQKVADKAFITPTALGQYFNELYNETVEQLQSSKAKLVADITTQLQANYDKQIHHLNDKIKSLEELHSKAKNDNDSLYRKEIDLQKQQLESLNKQYQDQLKETGQLNEDKLTLARSQIDNLKAQVATTKASPYLTAVLIVVALVLGLMVGKGCN